MSLQENLSRSSSLKKARNEGSTSYRLVNTEDDEVQDEDAGSSFGRGGGSKPPNPTTQEAEKAKEGVLEEGSFNHVQGIQVNPLFDGLNCYAISRLSLHIPSLGNVQVPDYLKHFQTPALNFKEVL